MSILEAKISKWMFQELNHESELYFDSAGEPQYTRLAEAAADAMDPNDTWLDDELHPVWEIAVDVLDEWMRESKREAGLNPHSTDREAKMNPHKTYRQLRTRVVRLRRRHRIAGVRGGFEVFGQQIDRYQQTRTPRAAALLADHWAEQNPGETFHVWSPDQQHCYEVVAISRSNNMSRTAGFDTDESVARELFDWINNSQAPYRQLQSIERNMTRKMAAGNYDRELAIKGFGWAAESGAKDYAHEFGGVWHKMFPKNVRRMAAEMLRDAFEKEVDLNPQDYERHVFKKHLPSWRERYRDRGANTKTAVRHPRDTSDPNQVWSVMIETENRDQLPEPYRMLDVWYGSEATFEVESADMLDPNVMELVGRVLEYDPLHPRASLKDAIYDTVVDALAAEGLSDEAYDDIIISVTPYGKRTNRGASVAQTRRTTMTQRPISRRRRQRLANRVERARSRENLRDRNITRERRAERHDSKADRLMRRIASLTRLLRTAERELRAAQQDDPRDRVAEIRERLEQERRPIRRRVDRSRRTAARLRREPEPRRPARRRAAQPQRREAAPKVIRRKSDGKLYVRVD